MENILGSELLLGGANKKVALDKIFSETTKFVGIYFGAHWAPPSRGFTETLKEVFYNG